MDLCWHTATPMGNLQFCKMLLYESSCFDLQAKNNMNQKVFLQKAATFPWKRPTGIQVWEPWRISTVGSPRRNTKSCLWKFLKTIFGLTEPYGSFGICLILYIMFSAEGKHRQPCMIAVQVSMLFPLSSILCAVRIAKQLNCTKSKELKRQIEYLLLLRFIHGGNPNPSFCIEYDTYFKGVVLDL